ncbi:MAG: hypothetical protein QOG18_1503 [Microbacteriaceae bacterium]|jgi:hypothetical protein|nr:hypothetical protein [Microbacteriaceae bacterium]
MVEDTSGKTPLSDEEKRAYVRSTRRFDLRNLLGALFVLYGIIVTILGIVNGAADNKQTGGIDINLWSGLAMLVLGVLFFLWQRWAPVPEEDILKTLEHEDEVKAEGEGRTL